jgi:hypothetical protein
MSRKKSGRHCPKIGLPKIRVTWKHNFATSSSLFIVTAASMHSPRRLDATHPPPPLPSSPPCCCHLHATVDEHAKLKTKQKTKLSSQPSYGTGFRYIGSPTTPDSSIASPTTRDSAIGSPTTCDSTIGSPTTRDSAIGSPTTGDSAIGSPTTRDSVIGSRVKWGQVSLIPKGSHKGWSEGSHKDKGCDQCGSAIP